MLPLYLFAVVPSSCDANWVTAHGAFEENAGKVFERDGYTNMLGEFNLKVCQNEFRRLELQTSFLRILGSHM